MKLRSYMGMIELEEYFDRVRDFHGFLAPGVVLGGLMVDYALDSMSPSEILDAIVETRKCLPDAVQILTKCSTGNGWMRVLDRGILAVTLYDKQTLKAARVNLDMQKAERFPLIRSWAMKERSKAENPLDRLIKEIIRAGREPLTCRMGTIEKGPLAVSPYGDPRICPGCGEAFRTGGAVCPGCLDPYLIPTDD